MPNNCITCRRRAICPFLRTDPSEPVSIFCRGYLSDLPPAKNEVARTCDVCPNSGECHLFKPGAVKPPDFCPMQKLHIHLATVPGKTKKMMIPENSKTWYPKLRTFLNECKQ